MENQQKGHGVLLLGTGGLGCAAAIALAGAGVRRLGVVDPDQVALSNLQRQILFHTADIGQYKVTAARHRLQERYPNCQVEPFIQRLTSHDAITAIARHYQVVLDGSDNFATRFSANDAAVLGQFPLVHGAATGTLGQLCTIAPGGQPCLRCLFGGPPDTPEATCRSEGVFGPLVGEIGWLMAMEAVKLLRGVGQPLFGRLLTIDTMATKRRTIAFSPNPDCPVCPTTTTHRPHTPDTTKGNHP